MKDLNILSVAQLVERKLELQSDIVCALNMFTEDTGIAVESVVTKVDTSLCEGPDDEYKIVHFYKVKIKMEV